MSEFGMSESSYFEASDLFLEFANFPHLTGIECWELCRPAAISGETVVTPLIGSATLDEKNLAIHEFMVREIAESNRRGLSLVIFRERFRDDGSILLLRIKGPITCY